MSFQALCESWDLLSKANSTFSQSMGLTCKECFVWSAALQHLCVSLQKFLETWCNLSSAAQLTLSNNHPNQRLQNPPNQPTPKPYPMLSPRKWWQVLHEAWDLCTLEIPSCRVSRCGLCQINLLQSVLITEIIANLTESALHPANLKLPYETITSF